MNLLKRKNNADDTQDKLDHQTQSQMKDLSFYF